MLMRLYECMLVYGDPVIKPFVLGIPFFFLHSSGYVTFSLEGLLYSLQEGLSLTERRSLGKRSFCSLAVHQNHYKYGLK